MEREKRQAALSELLSQAELKGYILFDDIMMAAETFSLLLPDFDWLTEAITSRGVLIYDEAPHTLAEYDEDDEVSDFAQVDYESIYCRVLELDPSLESIISEIRRIKPPQLHEVGQLKYLVKEGNQHARERMIEMHLRNAVRLALQRSEAFDYPIDEALQYAFIGLILAVDKYDPDINGVFASYANLYMVQSISRDQPLQNTFLYYPAHKKEELYSIYPNLKKHGCTVCPDIERCDRAISMICEELDCDKERTIGVIYSFLPVLSLDEQNELFLKNIHALEKQGVDVSHADNYSCLVVYHDDKLDEEITRQNLNAEVNRVLHTLSVREREVLSLRYGLSDGTEHTLSEVGDVFSVTRERIRQIEVKALTKLRHPTRSRNIRKILD